MQKLKTHERLLNWLVPKFFFATFVALLLVFSQSYVSIDRNPIFDSQIFEVSFSDFSPAFAAFEDEFLFSNQDGAVATDLRSGETESVYIKMATLDTTIVERPTSHFRGSEHTRPETSGLLSQFDGERNISEISSNPAQIRPIKVAERLSGEVKINTEGELAFGSLAGMVPSKPRTVHSMPNTYEASQLAQPEPHKSHNEPSVSEQSMEQASAKEISRYIVQGGIQLKEGLAFLGSMEVSWVVGDYELQRGSINAPDATYEIEVNKLVGDIIISLYDNQDELIGEGVLNLASLNPKGEEIVASIQVLPVDWDSAGQIVDASSLGTGIRKPVAGVEVALYSFNEATQSESSGEFSFYNWKKTNSRTLAIASKSGFYDSVFTLDSKTEALVLLFETKYMSAFFSYLQDLGVNGVKDKGTVYGKIQGVGNLEGYTVRLENSLPVYFMTAGFATLNRQSTSQNGLFSFVGLQDGDYELVVEKDGEILDERLVVVEQGKVSPVIVDLSKVSKHLEFFDPMDPDESINKVEISFFDGSTSRTPDQDNQLRQTMNRGHDLSLVEFKGDVEVSRTLLSRNKGLQKVPLINDKKLLELASSHKLVVDQGLVFGFVDSQDPYQVFLAEETASKILYFDSNGQIMNSEDPKPAYGFIIGGFSSGLSSVIVERKGDGMILGTDLIYSNHESIAVTHLELLPTN